MRCPASSRLKKSGNGFWRDASFISFVDFFNYGKVGSFFQRCRLSSLFTSGKWSFFLITPGEHIFVIDFFGVLCFKLERKCTSLTHFEPKKNERPDSARIQKRKSRAPAGGNFSARLFDRNSKKSTKMNQCSKYANLLLKFAWRSNKFEKEKNKNACWESLLDVESTKGF